VLVRPVTMDVGGELFFVRAHEADQRLVANVLVARGPQDHFSEHGSEINAFGRERIDALAPIDGIFLRGDNAKVLETTKTVGENVGGNFFGGLQKLVKVAIAAEHHVAENEQGPTVTEHFDGGVQRTARPPLRSGPLFRHLITVAYFHLQGASKIGRLWRVETAGRAARLVQ
jgi:hypothetical protein